MPAVNSVSDFLLLLVTFQSQFTVKSFQLCNTLEGFEWINLDPIPLWTDWSMQQWSGATGNVGHQWQSHPDTLPPVVPFASGSGSVCWLQTELCQLHVQRGICSAIYHTLRDPDLSDAVLDSHFDVDAKALYGLESTSICSSWHISVYQHFCFTM